MSRFLRMASRVLTSTAVACLALAGLAAPHSAYGDVPTDNEPVLIASDCKDGCVEGSLAGTNIPNTQKAPCEDSTGDCTKGDPNGNYSCTGCDPKPVKDDTGAITGCQVSCTGKSIKPVIID